MPDARNTDNRQKSPFFSRTERRANYVNTCFLVAVEAVAVVLLRRLLRVYRNERRRKQ